MGMFDFFGGSSANTDRREQLTAYGDLERVFNQFQRYAGQDREAGAINEGKSSNFYSSLLSGDPNKVAQAIGPSTNAARKTGETELKQLSSFGNRSGGTNQVAGKVGETGRGSIIDSILGARTGAAGKLGEIGGAQLGRANSELGGSGATASNLFSGATAARTQSAQLHAQAVRTWAQLITGAINGQGILSAASTEGLGG